MGVINLCAVLEYGRAGGVLRRTGVLGSKESSPGVRVMAKRLGEEIKMDVDEGKIDEDEAKRPAAVNNIAQSPTISTASSTASGPDDHPACFTLALQLTFTMLIHVLRHPMRQSSAFSRSVNPYLTIVLTFLATVCKQEKVLQILERSIPWVELASFLVQVPRDIMQSHGLCISGSATGKEHGEVAWTMLTSNCSPPLDEDWCMRGMEWVGRRVFERGYWKSVEESKH